MLDTIGAMATAGQATDLLNRLESDDTTSVLAAEIELGLLWGLSQVTEVNLHPNLDSKRQPEAFCPTLFKSAPAYIEVTAVSDDSFSDRDKMERAANMMCQFADRHRRGTSKHLYFKFAELSGYSFGRYRRSRRITSTFRLTPDLQDQLKNWLSNPQWPLPKEVRLTNDEIDVVVEWKKYVHPEGRTFSSMPPIAYDLEDNPVFKRLEKKRSQLSGAPKGTLKCIFLGDAGCNTLRELSVHSSGPGAVNGEQIVWHFLKKSPVDMVVVFSPRRKHNFPINSPRIWQVTIFDKRDTRPSGEHDLIDALVKTLPNPSYEGYQARSLHRQGAFAPQKIGREYLGSSINIESMISMKSEVKFSARLFQEFIAGRITADHFRGLNGALELFESQMKQGQTLSGARLESAGTDQDDDYLVFEFSPDPAARPLQNRRNVAD